MNSGFSLLVISLVLVTSLKKSLVFIRIIYLLDKSISLNEWPPLALTNRVRIHRQTKIKVLVDNT